LKIRPLSFSFLFKAAAICLVLALSGCAPSAQTDALKKGRALYENDDNRNAIVEYTKGIDDAQRNNVKHGIVAELYASRAEAELQTSQFAAAWSDWKAAKDRGFLMGKEFTDTLEKLSGKKASQVS